MAEAQRAAATNLSTPGRGLLINIVVFTILCTVILLLRFWAARLTKRRFHMDDGFVLGGFAGTITYSILMIIAIYHGLGYPPDATTWSEVTVQLRVFGFPAAITWLLATVWLKLSMLALYLRIFTTPKFRVAVYVLAAVIAAYAIAFIAVFSTTCSPISQTWRPVPGGWCRNANVEQYFVIFFNIVLNIAIVVIPLPILWQLQMPRRDKLFITLIFCLGSLAIGVMIWHLVLTYQYNHAQTENFVYLPMSGLSILLELWFGLIGVCLPTLGSLVQVYVKPAVTRLRHTTTSIRIRPKTFETPPCTGTAAVTTECAYDPTRSLPAEELQHLRGIYVRQDIEAQVF